MRNATAIGIMSDLHHQGPGFARYIAEQLQAAGASMLVLNGDMGNVRDTLQESQDRFYQTLRSVAGLGLPTFVQPGSHETVLMYEPVVDVVEGMYPDFHNAVHSPAVDVAGHRLAFLPGSTTLLQGAEYKLDDQTPTGKYMQVGDSYQHFDARLVGQLRQRGQSVPLLQVQNMHDLEQRIGDPERTIVFTHEPAHHPEAKEHAVDHAYFAVKQDDHSILPGFFLEMKIRQQIGHDAPYDRVQEVARANGWELMNPNQGNPALRQLFDRLSVRYAVTGHFHESSHHAHDRAGNPVEEGELVPTELFWNSGELDRGMAGLLLVGDEGVKYVNFQR
jgi:hypothetical protein